jgi:Ca2+-dependent lipid-binding protein
MDEALFGGGSDPYIIVTTDPASLLLYKGTFTRAQEGVKSSVIKHELNPVWKDSMEVALASFDLKGLARNASLIISCWDEDQYNPDDLIGVMSIPLKDILQAHADNKPYVFNQNLHSNTEIMGRLSGKITVQGQFQDLLKAYEQLESSRMSEGFTTLHQAALDHKGHRADCCTLC